MPDGDLSLWVYLSPSASDGAADECESPVFQSALLYNLAISAYPRVMTEITVSDARARLSDVVDTARVKHDPVYLTRRGRRVAAVIDADDLGRLVAAAEDLADIQAARAARAEIADGNTSIPWDKVKADLGLA